MLPAFFDAIKEIAAAFHAGGQATVGCQTRAGPAALPARAAALPATAIYQRAAPADKSRSFRFLV
jgi:hypothetical protein